MDCGVFIRKRCAINRFCSFYYNDRLVVLYVQNYVWLREHVKKGSVNSTFEKKENTPLFTLTIKNNVWINTTKELCFFSPTNIVYYLINPFLRIPLEHKKTLLKKPLFEKGPSQKNYVQQLVLVHPRLSTISPWLASYNTQYSCPNKILK